MELLALVIDLAVADLGRVARLGEHHRDLAHLAQLGQRLVVETVALFGLLAPELKTRAVVLVEAVRILLGQPVEFVFGRRPGVEVGNRTVLVEGRPGLVGDVVLVEADLVEPLRGADAVAGQILEQRTAVLLEVDLPGLLPAHDPLGQHVVHHHADQGQHAITPPGPLVDPALDDGDVVRVLLKDELDDLQPQGHVTGFVRLGREAESHGAHVAVVGRAGHKRHEQQVGEHVFEGEADGDHELERAGRDRIVKEGTRHRQVPHALQHVRRIVEAVVVLVVVRQGVDLCLRMTQLVERLHQAGHTRTGAREGTAGHGEATVRHVLERADAGQEQLDGIEVARVGHVQVTVVLRIGLDDGVELALLFRLVFPVGVHGQAERVFPLVPVVDLDALVFHQRVHILARLVGGFPVQLAGHVAVFFFQSELLAGACFHIHCLCSSLTRSSTGSFRRRSRPDGPRAKSGSPEFPEGRSRGR